jgi:hypothetical protein
LILFLLLLLSLLLLQFSLQSNFFVAFLYSILMRLYLFAQLAFLLLLLW